MNIFKVFDKISNFIETIVYGYKHVNTRHIPPRTGQIWENEEGYVITVFQLGKDAFRVKVSDNKSFVLLVTDTADGFNLRIKDGKYFLRNYNESRDREKGV